MRQFSPHLVSNQAELTVFRGSGPVVSCGGVYQRRHLKSTAFARSAALANSAAIHKPNFLRGSAEAAASSDLAEIPTSPTGLRLSVCPLVRSTLFAKLGGVDGRFGEC